MNPELFWISGPWRGSLAVVARPRGGDWLEDEASGWRRAGLDVLISLPESDEAAQLQLTDEQDVAESKGIAFISFPIPDRGVPASVASTLSLLRRISKFLDEGKNVAVHCRQGVGRSGLIAAGALIGSGIGADEAIKLVGAARGVAVPETREQLEWLHRLASEQPVEISS